MTTDELAALREQLTVAIADDPQFSKITLQLGRLVSHLESERRTRSRTIDMMNHHQRVLYGDPDDPAKPGMVSQVQTMWKWRGWLLSAASASVGSILTLLVKHFLP